MTHLSTTRRRFLIGLFAIVVLARWERFATLARAQSESKPPTPECPDDDDVTPRQAAGPFYTPDSPKRTSLLEPGLKGTPILVTGFVLTTDCKPVPNALLDFWQANDDGEYDNAGYTLRGHQFTDEHGRYRLETVVPGTYSGRTRHLHVRVQPPNQRVLTTQLYFPGEPANDRDGIFDPALLMDVKELGEAKEGSFTFVLKAV